LDTLIPDNNIQKYSYASPDSPIILHACNIERLEGAWELILRMTSKGAPFVVMSLEPDNPKPLQLNSLK
jgi:hypothetical protein